MLLGTIPEQRETIREACETIRSEDETIAPWFGRVARQGFRAKAERTTLVVDHATTKLIKIGAKVVGHAKYVTFQMGEVAVPRELFAGILERIQ